MKKWPHEVIKWLEHNVKGKTTRELTAAIKKQDFEKMYGLVFSEAIIKSAKSRYGLQSGTKGGTKRGSSCKYPEGFENYVKSIAVGRTTVEISRLVEEKYGIIFPVNICKAYKKNHGIVSGVDCRFKKGHQPANKAKHISEDNYNKIKATMFKKGHKPWNLMKVGDRTLTTDGYLIEKIKDSGTQRERFTYVHRMEWEKHYGSVPDGKVITFLDGDKANCRIENLVLVDLSTNLELNRSGLRFNNAELSKAGVNIAKLRVATRKRRKKSE